LQVAAGGDPWLLTAVRGHLGDTLVMRRPGVRGAVSNGPIILRSVEALSTLDGMTTRERLHRLVDDLNDDQAAAALVLLESQLVDEAQADALPEFFGMLRSGKGDLAARSEEILRSEFGRR
jgi:hypothetical protein